MSILETFDSVRAEFFAGFPAQPVKHKEHNHYPAEIRELFAEFIDALHREGRISDEIADSVTLSADDMLPLRLLPEMQFMQIKIPAEAQPEKLTDCQIVWRFTLQRNGHKMSGEYSQGIGHLEWRTTAPKYGRYSVLDSGAIRGAISTGKNKRCQVVKPKTADLLYCLLTDVNAGEESFPDFCSDFGYDEDSRKALGIWEACRKTKSEFPYSAEEIGELWEYLQDV